MKRRTYLFRESLERRELLAAQDLFPLVGDWNGDGQDTVGIVDRDGGTFWYSSEGLPDRTAEHVRMSFPSLQSVPIAGDWDGDGTDTFGIYDADSGYFHLFNQLQTAAADHVFKLAGSAPSDETPLAGDWDGDGQDGVGLYDNLLSRVRLKSSLASGKPDLAYSFDISGPLSPVAGDWNGDGHDSVGLYFARNSDFYLPRQPAVGQLSQVHFGPNDRQWVPLAGDWDGDGTITVGLFDPDNLSVHLLNRFDDQFGTDAYVHISLTAALKPTTSEVPAPFDEYRTTFTPRAPLVSCAPGAIELQTCEVQHLLKTAAGVAGSDEAIIAIVDRGGKILGVRAEQGALDNLVPGDETLVFAVDGAVAKARTAAFFANGDFDSDMQFKSGHGAPLTSRLIRFISQSTITQREVESNPNLCNPSLPSFDAQRCGPGFVAPIGLGGHFPPEVPHTPPVDLFAIEHTNRDGTVHPGADHVRGTADDIVLPSRFNVDPLFIPQAPGERIEPPDSYGFQSGRLTSAQSRGIATLPGGVPIYRDLSGDGVGETLIGGVGVFFPGPNGYATFEQGFEPRTPASGIPGYVGQTERQRNNAELVLEAEAIALATSLNLAPLPDIRRPENQLTLVGIALEAIGTAPDGLRNVIELITCLQNGIPPVERGDIGTCERLGSRVTAAEQAARENSGADLPVVPGSSYLAGRPVPQGWLVTPHDAPDGSLTAAEVTQIIETGIEQANKTRAAIRLPRNRKTKMVLAVSDTSGNVLGLYRMPDATVFSIDVAVAKSRNTAYYADPTVLQPVDQVDRNHPNVSLVPDFVPAGTAFSNRTFRFLAEPRFPSGVELALPPDFSILNDPGTNRFTAENDRVPADASDHQSVLGFDAFNPGSNFRDPNDIANQNGIVFFPGSTPLYKDGVLVGGFGVSGDGVDQDDVVTFVGADGFLPPSNLPRADQTRVRDVRLPFIKFLRNPEG